VRPVFSFISNLWKEQPRHIPVPARQHLMLAGLSQKSFLNQWGDPDIKICLDQLEGYFSNKSVVLSSEPQEEVKYSVWIYKNQDRIFFFTKQRLLFHYKWSHVRDKLKAMGTGHTFQPARRVSPFMTSTLALVA